MALESDHFRLQTGERLKAIIDVVAVNGKGERTHHQETFEVQVLPISPEEVIRGEFVLEEVEPVKVPPALGLDVSERRRQISIRTAEIKPVPSEAPDVEVGKVGLLTLERTLKQR